MKNKSILIIDDEVDVLEFLQLFLETSGYSVTVSDNCKQAIELLKEEDFFLVITDIAMPDMDGYEVIRAMEKVEPRAEFAVMTGFGYNPKHTLVKIRETHNCPCIFKPFNRNKVMECVREACERYNANES